MTDLSLFSIHPSRPNFNTNFGHVHCHQAFEKLMIPNFALAGSVPSRNYGLATFVHERLEWTLVDQSPDKSETEESCVDVAGYKIINVYKPPQSRLTPTAILTLPICNVSWRLQLPTCQLGLQQNISWQWKMASWAIANNLGLPQDPQGVVRFFSHW